MARRGSRRRRSPPQKLDQDDLNQISVFWQRMRENMEAAIRLSDRLSKRQSDDSDVDLRWALVKYVENAAEAVKELNKRSNQTFFKALNDVPFDSDGGNLSWRNLLRMRDLVVHRFWKVDHDQVQMAVCDGFSTLLPYIQTVRIHPTVIPSPTSGIGFGPVSGSEILALPPSEPGTSPKLGASLIYLFLSEEHGFGAVRLGRNLQNQLVIAVAPDWLIGTFRIRKLSRDAAR